MSSFKQFLKGKSIATSRNGICHCKDKDCYCFPDLSAFPEVTQNHSNFYCGGTLPTKMPDDIFQAVKDAEKTNKGTQI